MFLSYSINVIETGSGDMEMDAWRSCSASYYSVFLNVTVARVPTLALHEGKIR